MQEVKPKSFSGAEREEPWTDLWVCKNAQVGLHFTSLPQGNIIFTQIIHITLESES